MLLPLLPSLLVADIAVCGLANGSRSLRLLLPHLRLDCGRDSIDVL